MPPVAIVKSEQCQNWIWLPGKWEDLSAGSKQINTLSPGGRRWSRETLFLSHLESLGNTDDQIHRCKGNSEAPFSTREMEHLSNTLIYFGFTPPLGRIALLRKIGLCRRHLGLASWCAMNLNYLEPSGIGVILDFDDTVTELQLDLSESLHWQS